MNQSQLIRSNVIRMLAARGYDTDNITENVINGNDQVLIFHEKKDPSSIIYVFHPEVSTKIGVYIIKQYIKEMRATEVNRAIVIVKDAVTAFAKQIFKDAAIDDEYPVFIECFKENEFLIDKPMHILVPKHEIISEDEKKEVLEYYRITGNQMPKILSTDPIARYYRSTKGQVFKITRYSETCGETIYYRITV
jgi:DNA-directed RNA polymerase I, II, and III subunit RPABC1